MRTHWINDSQQDRPASMAGQKPKVFPWKGRAWLYLTADAEGQLGFEWNLKSTFCSADLRFGENEDDLGIHIAFPPVSFWFGLRARWARRLVSWLGADDGKTIGISIYDWVFHWDAWHGSFEGWNSTDPWWWSGHFDPIEFLLGRMKYSERLLERREVLVPMPEAYYHATAELQECTWRRPRLPFEKVGLYVKIDIDRKRHPGGIPHQGKGTAAHNCGVDGTFGFSSQARNIPEGVGKLVGSCLGTRVKYGGWRDWSWDRKAAA